MRHNLVMIMTQVTSISLIINTDKLCLKNLLGCILGIKCGIDDLLKIGIQYVYVACVGGIKFLISYRDNVSHNTFSFNANGTM